MNKKSPLKIGGLGLIIFIISLAIAICSDNWIFAIGAAVGAGMMIYGLFTGETKFLG